MITLLQIDKSGNEVLENDYSLVLILNKKYVDGVNVPQNIQDTLINMFNKDQLNINNKSKKQKKNRFKIRFHTAVIIQLIEKALKDLGYVDELNLELCNDIDGHFHEIKDMIFKRISRIIPFFKLEDIVLTRFSKPSLIDKAGRAFRERNKEQLKDYNNVDLNLIELIKIIKK